MTFSLNEDVGCFLLENYDVLTPPVLHPPFLNWLFPCAIPPGSIVTWQFLNGLRVIADHIRAFRES
jgi:hypothetical protein